MPALSDQDRLKLAAAQAAAVLVENGMIVGLGSGTTASLAVTEIGKRVAGGLRITGIPTSEKTAAQARSLGIPLSTLAEHDHIDLTIDGADEVEIGTLNLVKGLGGALLREKIVATNTERLVIVADESKLVNRLGIDNRPVPLEVVPFGWQATGKHLRALGATFVLRPGADGKPFVTDGGHYTLDCVFGPIESPERLQEKLDGMVGVVEHGMFLGLTSEVLMATEKGVTSLKRAGPGGPARTRGSALL